VVVARQAAPDLREDLVVVHSFDLWGGIATVATLTARDESASRRAEVAVHAWIERVDLAASTYRSDSEITALNNSQGQPMLVGPVLGQAIRVALHAAEQSEGMVDPTIGALTLSAATSAPTITRTGNYRDVIISDEHTDGSCEITMPAGIQLDLGATAKAWAADRAAALAAEASGTGVLVSLAGDIAMACPAPADGWTVLVTDDHRESSDSPGPAAQTISLTGGGLATSSTTVRRRATSDASTVAHIIDPFRWRPITPVWRTVSVAAGDCVTANTATTAALILGDRAQAWLEGTGLPARLVGVDGRILRLGGWPSDDREDTTE